MRIAVVGAYGLIGTAVALRLQRDGHEVVGIGRDVASARRRLTLAAWIALDVRRATPADWAAALDGAGALVNCAGVLQDSLRDDVQAVHVDALAAMTAACAQVGPHRIVHVSAAGLAPAQGPFARTKLAGEEALRGADVDWVILRPALVLGPSSYGGSGLLRGLAAFPGLILAMAPAQVVQTVWIDDVAEAVARSVPPGAPSRITCDLAAPGDTSLGEILRALRAWLGLPDAPLVAIPSGLGWAAAGAADALGWLGWRSPMRSTSVRQLLAGVRAVSRDAEAKLGFAPRPLETALRANPTGVEQRRHARAYFVKPLALATLAAFWAASGLVGLTALPAAARVLTSAGFDAGLARGLAVGGAVADLALAAGVAVRRTAPSALKGMLALSAAYLGAASIWTPGLWADPLGPLVKIIPAAALALAALALMDER